MKKGIKKFYFIIALIIIFSIGSNVNAATHMKDQADNELINVVEQGVTEDSNYSFSLTFNEDTYARSWGYDGKLIEFESDKLKRFDIFPQDHDLSGNIGYYVYNCGKYNGHTVNLKCTFDWEKVTTKNGMDIHPYISLILNKKVQKIGFGFSTLAYGVKYELLDENMQPLDIDMSINMGDIDTRQYYGLKVLSGKVNNFECRNDSIVYYEKYDDMHWFFADGTRSENGLESVVRIELDDIDSFYIWYGCETDCYSKAGFTSKVTADTTDYLQNLELKLRDIFSTGIEPSSIGGWGFFDSYGFGPYDIPKTQKKVTDQDETQVLNNRTGRVEEYYYDIYQKVPLEAPEYYYTSFEMVDKLSSDLSYISSSIYDIKGQDVTELFTITNYNGTLTAKAKDPTVSAFYNNTYNWKINVKLDLTNVDLTSVTGVTYDDKTHSYITTNKAKTSVIRNGKQYDIDSNETATTYTKKEAKVVAKYIDVNNEEASLCDDIEQNGYVDDSYTTEQKSFTGYKFIGVDGNANGNMTEDTIEVIYKYAKELSLVTNYVDEISKEVISPKDIQSVVQGNEYTTQKLEIPGYTYVSDTKNISGTVGTENIDVTYYYRKNAKVVAKYIDMLNGDTISTDVLYNGLQGKEYKTEKLDISGYKFVEVEGNEEGLYTADTIEVTYKYKKQANVIVEYIDEKTKEKIIDDEITTYAEGEAYEVNAKDFEGYVLVEEPEEKKGIVEREDITKAFYYKKVSAGLLVKYVDITTKELLDQVNHQGNEDDEVILEEKSFEEYKLVSRPEEEKVILTVEAQEKVFYYVKEASQHVIGIDQNTKEELYSYDIDGYEGEDYKTEGKNVEGYKLVVIPQNKDGILDRENEDVVYEYRKIGADVTIKYVDKETGEVLLSKIETGLCGEEYTSEVESFDKYNFVEVVGDISGTIKEEEQEVVYYYEKKKGELVVIYKDKEENVIRKEITIEPVDTDYKVTPKEIFGYEIVETPDNEQGKYIDGKVEVVYIVDRKIGSIIVNFKDEEGNVLSEQVVDKNFVGEDFFIEAPTINGYDIIGNPTVKSEYIDGELVYDIVYEKKAQKQEVIEEAPETSDINVFGLIVLTIASIFTITLNVKKLLNNKY